MLNNLKPVTSRKAKRVGRGYGSGKGGHTSSRGQKGQKSRSGYKAPRPGFEGGRMPLSRRLPKNRGFTRSYFKKRVNAIIINLSDIERYFEAGSVINVEKLVEKGFIISKSKVSSVKILGFGELTKKVEVDGLPISNAAKEKIEAKGGTVKV